MDKNTVLLFTRYGLGDAPDDLRLTLAVKFLTLINEAGVLPAKISFINLWDDCHLKIHCNVAATLP